MVYGPAIHNVKSLSSLNTSSGDIFRLINGSEKDVPTNGFWAFADVRDVALAHVLAYEKDAAAGQRYLISGGSYMYQWIADIIRAKFPELESKTPKGNTGASLPSVYSVDTSKASKELGIKFTPLEKTVEDGVASLLELQKRLGN
jgi:nucleoside-diphosphate-sugar epimerase